MNHVPSLFVSMVANFCISSLKHLLTCSQEVSHLDDFNEYPQHRHFHGEIQVYRHLVKIAYQKIIFLFLNQNICCGNSKEQSQ